MKETLRCMFLFMWAVLMLLLQGVVVNDLWAWFIIPLFGLPVIGVIGAIGLVLVVSATRGYTGLGERSQYPWWVSYTTGVLYTLMLWGIGWAFSHYLPVSVGV